MPSIEKYFPKSFNENFEKWSKRKKSDRKNTSITLKNGVIQPVVKRSPHKDAPRVDVGVFTEDGRYILGSNMWSAHEEMFADIPEYMPIADAKLVWGGELFNHYGHFLTQSTARIYHFLKHIDEVDGIIFVWCWNSPIPKYMIDFLELAGVPKNKIKITNQMLKVRELIVPSLSSYNCYDWTEDFLVPFKNAASRVKPCNHKKIYLSRKYWKLDKAKVLGEKEIENAFNKNGFKSIYPEKMKISEQISAILGADEIAGICGTALHNILFAAGYKKRMIMLCRTEVFNVQFMLNEMTRTDTAAIKAFETLLPVAHADGPFVMGMTDELRKFFKDSGMKDFGIRFEPKKFANEFAKLYAKVYSVPNHIGDLKDQCGTSIDVKTLTDFLKMIS